MQSLAVEYENMEDIYAKTAQKLQEFVDNGQKVLAEEKAKKQAEQKLNEQRENTNLLDVENQTQMDTSTDSQETEETQNKKHRDGKPAGEQNFKKPHGDHLCQKNARSRWVLYAPGLMGEGMVESFIIIGYNNKLSRSTAENV